MDIARETLTQLRRDGLVLSTASAAIGRNQAFLGQFLDRGSPRQLRDQDRRHLAMHLNIDERKLGARDPWSPIV